MKQINIKSLSIIFLIMVCSACSLFENIESSKNDITEFAINNPWSAGSINSTTNEITVTVPYGTLLTSLTTEITHTGQSINPANGSEQNFTNPVEYTVTAENGSTQIYTVIVNSAAAYSVEYFGNGHELGAVPVDNQKYEQGREFNVLDGSSMTRAGYQFAGWNTKDDGNGITYTVSGLYESCPMGSEDIKLYAVWVSNIFEITIRYNNIIISGTTTQPSGDVIIPSGVTTVQGGFYGNKNVTSIYIPKSVKSWGNPASSCDNLLEYIVDPANEVYKSVNGVIYSKNGDVLVDAPSSISGAFSIPDGVKEIKSRAFWHRQITSITIPNTVEIIGTEAFFGCNIPSIHIPESVTKIEKEALDGWNVKSITVDSGNLNYSSRNGTLYNKDQTILIQPPQGETGTYTVPNGVKEIFDDAFGSSEYSQIILPESLRIIGSYAFWQCFNLKEIVLPNSLKTIKRGAFWKSGLVKITIPQSVTSIGDGAFERCLNLAEITLTGLNPPLITEIYGDPDLFKDCPLSLKIHVPGTALWDYKGAPGWSFFWDKIVSP